MSNKSNGIEKALEYAEDVINAVPVVRCGECLSAKWYESGDFYCQKWGERCDSPYTLTGQSKTDFCSHGSKEERKEE